MKGLLEHDFQFIDSSMCKGWFFVESRFECASGCDNGTVLGIHIAFNPSLATLPVWMGQEK